MEQSKIMLPTKKKKERYNAMLNITELILKAAEYDIGDPKRINHFIKVHSFAKIIGEKEGLTADSLNLLEAAAVLHDIGIHNCEKKYGSTAGNYQQTEGVPVAEDILVRLGAERELIENICFLIAHHHTYTGINSIEWQILIEADFLVNAYEDELSAEAVKNAGSKIFRTDEGKKLLKILFSVETE